MSGFELIGPYIRPLSPFLADEEVSEILVNADGGVFIERNGCLEPVPDINISEDFRKAAVTNIARLLGDDIDERQPLLDSRLEDGSRVAAVMPPASVGGTILCIRKFRKVRFTAQDLVDREMLSQATLDVLVRAIEARQTILISGGTSSGKTSLLNALTAYLPKEDRVVLIEETSEVVINRPNLVRLEAKRAQPDAPAVTIRDLLKQTLRLRPDWIIVGEVRDAAAFDFLESLNTGHAGSMGTVHANSARRALRRLRTCIAMADMGIPDAAVAQSIAESIQVIVQVERVNGRRRVAEVLQIVRYDAGRDEYQFNDELPGGMRIEEEMVNLMKWTGQEEMKAHG